MASHLGACSPAVMCKKVNAEKPTTKAIVSRAVSDSTLSKFISGFNKAANTGSPTQPRPRLARVMPSWQALNEASRLPSTRLAILARRCPLAISGANWVSRTLTSANSAATKKPLSNTSAATASSLRRREVTVSPGMLQTHLSENEFENVLQADDPDLALVAAEDDAKTLTAALHPSQCLLPAHLFAQIQRRLHVIAGGSFHIQIAPIQERFQTHHPHDAAAIAFLLPDGQARQVAFAAQAQHLLHGRLRRYRGRLLKRSGDLAHSQMLQVQHPVDHR